MRITYELTEQQIRANRFENLTFHEHLHKETEIVLLLEGEIEITISGKKENLKAGDAAIIFPNERHSYKTAGYSKGLVHIIGLHMTGDYEKQLTGYHCQTPFLKKEQLSSHILMCMESLMLHDPDQKAALVKGYTTVLLGNLFDILQLKKRTHHENHSALDIVLQFVTDHYREPVSLNMIAAATGISKYTISRIFNHELGCNLNDYLNSLRLGFAQHLLGNQQMSITEIAYESGFSSLRTFNRAFREMYHTSPRSYRQNIQ